MWILRPTYLKQWTGATQPGRTRPNHNAFWQLIFQKLNEIKNVNYEEMHSILNCELSNFQRDLLNVTIMKSIKYDDIFQITR